MNLSVFCKSLGHNQLSISLIKNLNNIELVCSLFYEEPPQLLLPANFLISYYYDGWHSNGIVLAVDEYAARTTLHLPRPKHILFYVYDLNWFDNTFKDNIEIYKNDRISLLARSQSHFNIIKKTWKEPLGIVEDFNHAELTRIFRKLQ